MLMVIANERWMQLFICFVSPCVQYLYEFLDAMLTCQTAPEEVNTENL